MTPNPVPEPLVDGPKDAPLTMALAHGAGGPMDSPFLAFFAHGLAGQGFRIVRFEFPYMAERRRTGRRRPPDRADVLLETWREVIRHLGPERLAIGGKSLGGRIASLVADEAGVRGLICLGYPFHPPGEPNRLRTEHLKVLQTPTLILQGTRDPFGSREEIAGRELSPAIKLHWLVDGDHSLTSRQRSGRTERQNWEEALVKLAEFLTRLVESARKNQPRSPGMRIAPWLSTSRTIGPPRSTNDTGLRILSSLCSRLIPCCPPLHLQL